MFRPTMKMNAGFVLALVLLMCGGGNLPQSKDAKNVEMWSIPNAISYAMANSSQANTVSNESEINTESEDSLDLISKLLPEKTLTDDTLVWMHRHMKPSTTKESVLTILSGALFAALCVCLAALAGSYKREKQLAAALDQASERAKKIETDKIETDQIETDKIETDQIETDKIETKIETDKIETDKIETKIETLRKIKLRHK